MNHEDISISEVSWETHRDALLAVRTTVFVEEQKVPASIEVDEYDPVSVHLLALDHDGTPIGTARLLPESKIGRVAVLKSWRRSGIGSALMHQLIRIAKERGDSKIILHAQSWTVPFYESLGFLVVGDEFEEAGILHREMHLVLC